MSDVRKMKKIAPIFQEKNLIHRLVLSSKDAGHIFDVLDATHYLDIPHIPDDLVPVHMANSTGYSLSHYYHMRHRLFALKKNTNGFAEQALRLEELMINSNIDPKLESIVAMRGNMSKYLDALRQIAISAAKKGTYNGQIVVQSCSFNENAAQIEAIVYSANTVRYYDNLTKSENIPSDVNFAMPKLVFAAVTDEKNTSYDLLNNMSKVIAKLYKRTVLRKYKDCNVLFRQNSQDALAVLHAHSQKGVILTICDYKLKFKKHTLDLFQKRIEASMHDCKGFDSFKVIREKYER